MDIFAHGLWAGAAYKALNKKYREPENKPFEPTQGHRKPLNLKWAVFWGIFPDLFAFTIPFVWGAWGLLSGSIHLSDLPHPGVIEPPDHNILPLSNLAHSLYDVSHSLIVLTVVFVIIWFILKRPWLEMGGWLLHILIDIPTHSYKFYPTPILWPLSSWKFLYGFSWADLWFIIINYSALVIVYIILRRKPKQEKQT